MNTQLLKAALSAVALSTCASTFAQDAVKTAPMQNTNKAMQDCRDHMATAKGEKRNDTPPTAETDKACSDTATKGDTKGMKTKPVQKQTGVTQEKPTK